MSAFSINKDDTSIYGYLLGLLNSPLGDYIFNMLNPTISLQVGNFSNFPVLQVEPRDETGIYDLVHSSVSLTKADWNAFETAWGFQSHKFSYHIAEHHRNWTVEAAYKTWEKEAADRFDQLKSNEEELNRIFIDLYGLQDELSPEVEDADVSVRHADPERDIRSFLSYFIGVSFGRYSIDTPGLAFAGGEWDTSKYQTYQPNKDDVIVLTNDDYFGDNRDIINRLKEFLIATFGDDHLSENLNYIASQLNKKGETPEEQIRRYFIEDFFKKDHLSTYQKRPIYWELNSGKQGGFKALMYLHRYDENTMAMIRTSYLVDTEYL